MPSIFNYESVKQKSILFSILASIFCFYACSKNQATKDARPTRTERQTEIPKDTTIVSTDTSITEEPDSSVSNLFPQIESLTIVSLTESTASFAGEIIDLEKFPMIEVGICYGVQPQVSMNDMVIRLNELTRTFKINLASLDAKTTYYARLYTKNSSEIKYGKEISFTTLSGQEEPFDINGLWTGLFIDSSVICKTLMRMQMSVTINGNEFRGIITATDDPNFPVRTLIGVINSDSTELTLEPDGQTVFQNPWRIVGNRITGDIQLNPPIPPDTIVVRWRYEFIKK